jgi:DNA-binding response OmpR family regulator
LGYALGLTQREYQVLSVLVGAERGLSKSEICRLVDSDSKLKENSIAVHICAINKKAELLGWRRLVEFTKKDGYFINENA